MNKQEISEDIAALEGQFTWLFTDEYFIETSQGNFVYSDPLHQLGTGELKIVKMSFRDYCATREAFGETIGIHRIGTFIAPVEST